MLSERFDFQRTVGSAGAPNLFAFIALRSFLIVAAMSACTDPTGRAPSERTPSVTQPGLGRSSGASSSIEWLPPIGNAISDPAQFDSSLAPVVEICRWNGASCSTDLIARFAITPTGFESLLERHRDGGFFQASWDLSGLKFEGIRTFHVRVLLSGTEVGMSSIDVGRGRWALTPPNGASPVMSPMEILPIRFSLVSNVGLVTIGPGGGTATAPGSGARVVVQAGTFSSQQTLSIQDMPLPNVGGTPLDSTAVHVAIPLSALGTTGGVLLDLPVAAGPASGETAYAHVQLLPGPADYYAEVSFPTGNRAVVQIPLNGLQELATQLPSSTLDMIVWVQSYPTLTSTTSGREALSANQRLAASSSEPCQPAVAQLNHYAPCGQTVIRDPDPSRAGIPAVTGPSVVLVHGWQPTEVDWVDYYTLQGMNCILVRFHQCTLPANPSSSRTLPGEAYFNPLYFQLHSDLPNASVLVFDYESFQSIGSSAQGLASELSRLFQSNGRHGFVLVAHSMGGLVARAATQLVEPQFGVADTVVRGIITLASPHLGTPLPTLHLAHWLFPGVPTAGGLGLAAGVPRGERAPLYVYGGTLDPGTSVFNNTYWIPYTALCTVDNSYCLPPTGLGNDGVVPISSALPDPARIPSVRQRTFPKYDHTMMQVSVGRDPLRLYDSILVDVCRQLPCLEISPRQMHVALGDPPVRVSATLRGVDARSAVSWRTTLGVATVVGNGQNAVVTPAHVGAEELIARIEIPSPGGRVVEDTVQLQVTACTTNCGTPPTPSVPSPTPVPPPNPSTGNPIISWGDPHLVTPDGMRYDFQARGDFVLAKSTDPNDDFEVHIRLVPGPATGVTATDAVASRILGDVVAIYPTGGAFDLEINGQVVTATNSFTRLLPGGGAVQVTPSAASITWPDRTVLTINQGTGYSRGSTVLLSPARIGKVHGLGGNYDGDAANDLLLPSGLAPDSLYGNYRTAWRVPLGSANALFQRGPDPWDFNYPSPPALGSFPSAALNAAMQTCIAAGVVSPAIIASCALDVLATGDPSLALASAKADPAIVRVQVSPSLSYITVGGSLDFVAAVSGLSTQPVSWSASSGAISITGSNSMHYSAPSIPGTYTITATSTQSTSSQSTAIIIVTATAPSVTPNSIITTIAGTGVRGFSGDGGLAVNAKLDIPVNVAVGFDSSLYVSSLGDNRVRRVATNGIIRTVAGNGTYGISGDGGPATSAQLAFPRIGAIERDGSFDITDGACRIRRVDSSGIINSITGAFGAPVGDGGLASATYVCAHVVRLAPDGSLLLVDWNNNLGSIRRIGTNGIITTVYSSSSSNILVDEIEVGPDSAIYFTERNNSTSLSTHFIKRLDRSGTVITIAGTGAYGETGDGGPATQAEINSPTGLTFGPDKALYFISSASVIRRVDTNGVIGTIGGTPGSQPGFSYGGDGGPVSKALFDSASDLAFAADGALLIVDGGNYRLRRIK